MERPPVLRSLTGSQLWPSLRAALGVLALFGAALVLVHVFAEPIRSTVAAHAALGAVLFVATSVLAVLVPMLTNLPLLPIAVLAWGPWWTAALLLLGWIGGAALSFWLARHARAVILRHFPSVQRHADIDGLIHPRHPLASLVLLRMTFPVDVLSYALGLFSGRTTLAENALSTALGAAPFALMFALFPTWPASVQLLVFAVSAAVFVLYVAWLARGAR